MLSRPTSGLPARWAARSLSPSPRPSSAAPTARRRSLAASTPPTAIIPPICAASWSGVGGAYAYQTNLAAAGGGERFLVAFVFGALAYAGVDALIDYSRILSGERTKMQTWRKYALGAALGGVVAGAIGWYFDTAQLQVVVNKFWAYADVNYRLSGRKLGDFTTYPIFNKYGAVNLGEVAGGVRLFWAESVAGVINWSLAAPLFSINFVLLAAVLEWSLKPLRELFSAKGAQGLIEQAVRVLRWGLWMPPIINTFLRQSADPSWFNQDGAVRTIVATGADSVCPTPITATSACRSSSGCSPTTGCA